MTVTAFTSNLVFNKDFQKQSVKQLKEIRSGISHEFDFNEDLTNDEMNELLDISDIIDNIINSKISPKSNIFL